MTWRIGLASLLLACSVDGSPLLSAGGSGISAGLGGIGGSGGAGAIGGTAGTGGTGGLGGTGGSAGSAGTGSMCVNGCDDGVYCNGVETCGASGCVPGVAPCPVDPCNEAEERCEGPCSEDVDRDGAIAMRCGGTDCNDSNAAIGPSGLEICNFIDDDCNGMVDDGFAQISCFLPNTTFALCLAGTCVVTACNDGFDNCDGVSSNGCETLLDSTPNDCKQLSCAGGFEANPSDQPIDDGNDCTIERCSGAAIEITFEDDGEPCSNDTGVCAGGTCVY